MTKLKALELKFKAEICDRAAEVDPNEERDWYSLSLGWALARGLSVDEANKFAIEVRYTHHYWCP